MNKRKRSQNQLVYWWNEFLFARYFEYETDLTPQQIAEQLEALAHKRQGWMWGLEKTTKVTMHPNEKGLDFDVQSRRRRLFDPIGITTARTLGTAMVDSATGQTIVTGDVKLGRFIQIFFFLYVAMIFMSIFPLVLNEMATVGIGTVLGMLSPLIFVGIAFGLLWLRIYVDRNNLAELIETAIYPEFKHLAINDQQNDDWYMDDDNQQHNHKRNL